ncbi:ABC transporter ATP-binding protein [Polynucleobacter sp. MWH-Tro8-2-5-gr]|jgi:branched-chain amino acid transport system ATP-binding protein|uniref:ABC transporter ATP-binding protein n=1 Tax=Polynucleobacter sp. MWH-Tro8-2-5-gr TaxID=1855606 RepID=UPI0008F94CDD|nr:ABC transporter ATP-binding protein [Polynucleobacter sp. MWH-Tro8-2-5-gr]OIM97446.1 ABC transporter ATP-binding protein [Polynucleobacter sp. MWH-Tro8-2-5-gr]
MAARLLLDVADVSKRFGGVQALDSVGLEVPHGSIVGLIGPNGAGKTTFFNVITGLYPADSGIFLFDSNAYFPESVSQVTQSGMARTFQNIRLFGEMTVLENVMVGCHCRSKAGLLGAIFRFPSTRREELAIREKSLALLAYVGLSDYAQLQARNLSYGHQRRLEIARALATEPKLLALDEPAAGMNATEKLELRELLLRIRADGKTILLIEHDVSLVMGICDSLTVLDYGKVIAAGKPADVRVHPEVIKAYLGQGAV